MTIEWKPLSGSFGAEVSLDLSKPISDSTRSELTTLFNDRQMLVFKSQRIDLQQQIDLVSTFAPLVDDPPVPHKTVKAGPGRYVTNVRGEENVGGGELDFHTELAYLESPIYGLSLWAEEVSPHAAATMFASNRDALYALPAALRSRIADLKARHVSLYPAGPPARNEAIPADAAFSTIHPLVYVNPRTGEEVLFMSHRWTHSVAGYHAEQSIDLLNELEAVLYEPDRIIRHSWEQHDLVVWDNICVQHAREPVEIGGPPRRLRRVAFGDPSRYVTA